MSAAESTCWTVIRDAAEGDAEARELFARRYAPAVRAYLAARPAFRRDPHRVEDGVQEVFLECFRLGGALDRVERGRAGGFRAFFFGVVRNVGLRLEERRARNREVQADTDADPADRLVDSEDPAAAFDRAFALAALREAQALHAERARAKGGDALRRVEILRLRFGEGLPIRDVAARLNEDAAKVHHAYALARKEFRAALEDVVAFHQPDSAEERERECVALLEMLG